MPELSRRGLLGASAAVTGAMAAGVVLRPLSAQAESSAESPKSVRHGDIQDGGLIGDPDVVRNRSFDHHFARPMASAGSATRSTITLTGGASVFQLSTTTLGHRLWTTSVGPWSALPLAPLTSGTWTWTSAGLGHAWADQHGAW